MNFEFEKVLSINVLQDLQEHTVIPGEKVDAVHVEWIKSFSVCKKPVLHIIFARRFDLKTTQNIDRAISFEGGEIYILNLKFNN